MRDSGVIAAVLSVLIIFLWWFGDELTVRVRNALEPGWKLALRLLPLYGSLPVLWLLLQFIIGPAPIHPKLFLWGMVWLPLIAWAFRSILYMVGRFVRTSIP
jgi:hypothetical protein